MTLLEIYNRAVFYIYGDQNVPSHITTQLQGGIIPGIHRRIQEEFNYWFMESDDGINTIIDEREYVLPTHFKSEVVFAFLDDNNVRHDPLKKLRRGQDTTEFPNIDDSVEWPTHYEIWKNKIILYPKPSHVHLLTSKFYEYIPKPLTGLDNAVVLSVGTADDTKIKSTAINYRIGGISYTKVLAETAFTAGEDVTADCWGTYLLSIDTAGDLTLTQGSIMNGATEADAIAGLADTPTGECRVGYLTMTTAAGVIFDAGTDSPEGGVSGNVSLATNYYPDDIYTDDLLDEASELIVFMTCLEIEQMLEHDPKNIQLFMQRIGQELKVLRGKHEDKAYANFRELEYRDA